MANRNGKRTEVKRLGEAKSLMKYFEAFVDDFRSLKTMEDADRIFQSCVESNALLQADISQGWASVIRKQKQKVRMQRVPGNSE